MPQNRKDIPKVSSPPLHIPFSKKRKKGEVGRVQIQRGRGQEKKIKVAKEEDKANEKRKKKKEKEKITPASKIIDRADKQYLPRTTRYTRNDSSPALAHS